MLALRSRLRTIPGLRRVVFIWRTRKRGAFPSTADQLRASDIYKRWWYYSVELLPNVITKGIYPDTFPMLPRLMLRHCTIEGMDCLDMGSMEGLIPVLMRRRGARRVLATDAVDHCVEKIAAIQHYHRIKFQFRTVGLMYGLDKKLPRQCFDLINCSGLLYHVVSPFMVLASARSLLKRNGLMIVSTNVAAADDYVMEFNQAGRLQKEANTFWYISVPLLDYLLRYLKLAPLDCVYLPHANIKSDINYVADKPSGYLSVVCRAVDDMLPASSDNWMRESGRHSWEYVASVDWKRAQANQVSSIEYHGNRERRYLNGDTGSLDLWRAVKEGTPLAAAQRSSDAHTLKLEDPS